MRKFTRLFLLLAMIIVGSVGVQAQTQVHATFENPQNTNAVWDKETSSFSWTQSYYNQIGNVGLPNGDISNYKKLVVDYEFLEGDQFRILFYQGGSNIAVYVKKDTDGAKGQKVLNIYETLSADANYSADYILKCTEIKLSGAGNSGKVKITDMYLETYADGEEKPDVKPAEDEVDPGKPAGEFIDFTAAFPNLQPEIGIGKDNHPIVKSNGEVIVGQRSKNVIADLSGFSKLTMVTSPNLKLVLYMNHEIDAQQNAGDYGAEDEGKYVFMDVQADENGIIEVDLTKFEKADLNCICLPWDNANKGTVWYILLTEKDAKTIYLKPAIWDVTDATERYAVYMFNNNELNAWADFTAVEGAEGTFTATVPARYTGIVLGRMNGATTENNWDNVWNQTVDIKPVNDKALYTITGWGEGDGAKSTYEETVYASDQPEPIVINSMAIVGDFTGGWPVQKQGSEEFDWSVAKQMTKSTENADVWTLTIENFEAEAKKYEYKAAANDSWEGYQLPAEGNADFVFGTDMYPAGKYNLTFTVNTKENTLTLGVEKVIEPFVAPFADGNYYIMNATEGLFIPQSGGILQADGYPFLFKFDNKEGSYSIIGNEFFAWDGKKWFAEGESGFYKFYYIDKDNVKRYAVISSRNGMAVDVEENTTQENSIWMPLTQSSVEDQFMSYNVAGTEDLCGVAWDITKNKMARNTETDLFEWKAENITVTNEIKPEFKVVATLEDKGSVWYPEGGENSNWVITLGALGADAANPAEEGIYTITISFNAASKEIKVAGEKTGDYVPPVKPTDIAIAPAEGDIAAALKAAEEGVEKVGNITINLTKGVVYTISEPIVAPASITINGNDAFLDAANLTGNGVVTMADVAEPTEWTVANVRIAGLSIKGLKKPLFYSTCKNYVANMFEVDWVTAEIAADVTVFDYTKGSTAENFIVTNSTFYAPTATTKSFYSSQGGQKLTEWNSASDAMQTFKFAGNTMYNLAPTKNFFTHRQANQKWMTYGVEDNIFVNCGKSGQVIKGMNGGQSGANPVWIIEGNAFNFDGADTSASEETGDANEPVKASVAGVVTFTDADAGNFNGEFQLAEGATAPEALGAPAWKITFKEYVAPIVINSMAIVGDFTGGWPVQKEGSEEFDWSVAKQMTKSTENADVWTLTIEGFEAEAKKYEYKAAANDSWTGYQLPAEGNADFVFGTDMYPAGTYNLTFTANTKENTLTLSVEKVVGPVEPVIPEGTYYVMSSADDNPHLFLTANPAVDNEGTAFGFKFDGVTGAYTVFSGELQLGKCFIEGEDGFYKICRPENGNKSYFAINEAKELYSTDDADKAAWWSFILPEAKAYFYDYTVAGAIGSKNAGEADALFGLAWDVTNTANDLEIKSVDENTVIYTKTIKGVKLEANDVIYYKVVRDHSWNYKDWGFNNGANADYVITTAGTYDITFTFDPTAVLGNGFNLTCTAELDVATGISVIAAEAQKGNVYDMQGRRVVKPAKGMYIVNGKKMYVK